MSKSHYSRRITTNLLAKHKACQSQLRLFERIFPNGCVLTRLNLATAAVGQLNLRWAVYHLMSHADAEEVMSVITHNDSNWHNQRVMIDDIYRHDPDQTGRAERRDQALRMLYFQRVTSEAAAIADFLDLK